MFRFGLLLITLFLVNPASAQPVTPTGSQIFTDSSKFISPSPGQVLQGLVPIRINLPAEVASAELAFSYEGDPRNTWFLIAEFADPAQGVLETDWDTTTLTDDNYTLRLIVRTTSGPITVLLAGLRVRNYTPIETDTPIPTSTPAPRETLSPSFTPTVTESSTPPTMTPLPPNPARITIQQITISAGKGVGVTLLIFLLLGIYRTVTLRSRQ